MQQHGRHGGIHAATQAEYHFFIANLGAQGLNRCFDEGIRRPVPLAAADIQRKVGQHLRTLCGMINLRMELHRVSGFAFELIGGVHHIGRGGNDLRSFREGRYGIPVRHPHLRFRAYTLQEGRRGHGAQHGAAVFAAVGSLYLAAAGMGQVLGAVADAQQRQTAAESTYVHLRGIGVPHAAGTAGKDDTLHRAVQGRYLIIRVDFAIYIQFAQAPPDELRNLRAEVQNEDLIHCSWALSWQ